MKSINYSLNWNTVSSWIDETFELFSYIQDDYSIDDINNKVSSGIILGDRKKSSSKRVYSALKTRYLWTSKEKIVALSCILRSSLTKQDKYNILLLYYFEKETLLRYFLESYVFTRFNDYSQKIYTQKDLDKFFEELLLNQSQHLSRKLQEKITDASINKVRNQLFKFFEDFKWGNKKDEKIYIKRPVYSPEWIVYTLYYLFDDQTLSQSDVYSSNIYKAFLLSETDIEYLLSSAQLNGLIEIQSLGDISIINKKEKGLLEYAESIR
jgi:hypothetical protein